MFLAILKVPCGGRVAMGSALMGMSVGLVWAQAHWLFGLQELGMDVGDPTFQPSYLWLCPGHFTTVPHPILTELPTDQTLALSQNDGYSKPSA